MPLQCKCGILKFMFASSLPDKSRESKELEREMQENRNYTTSLIINPSRNHPMSLIGIKEDFELHKILTEERWRERKCRRVESVILQEKKTIVLEVIKKDNQIFVFCIHLTLESIGTEGRSQLKIDNLRPDKELQGMFYQKINQVKMMNQKREGSMFQEVTNVSYSWTQKRIHNADKETTADISKIKLQSTANTLGNCYR